MGEGVDLCREDQPGFLDFLVPATLTTLYQGSVTSFCHGEGEGERKPGWEEEWSATAAASEGAAVG